MKHYSTGHMQIKSARKQKPEVQPESAMVLIILFAETHDNESPTTELQFEH